MESKYNAIHEGLWDMDSRHVSGLTRPETQWEMYEECTAWASIDIMIDNDRRVREGRASLQELVTLLTLQKNK